VAIQQVKELPIRSNARRVIARFGRGLSFLLQRVHLVDGRCLRLRRGAENEEPGSQDETHGNHSMGWCRGSPWLADTKEILSRIPVCLIL
jgi:hypothetical protein